MKSWKKPERNRRDYDKADENLEKALQALAGDQNKQEKKEQQQQKKEEEQKSGEDNKDEKKAQPLQPQNLPEQQGGDKEIDEAQAEALLDLMANDEKALRDALKEMQRNNSKIKNVDKDW